MTTDEKIDMPHYAVTLWDDRSSASEHFDTIEEAQARGRELKSAYPDKRVTIAFVSPLTFDRDHELAEASGFRSYPNRNASHRAAEVSARELYPHSLKLQAAYVAGFQRAVNQ